MAKQLLRMTTAFSAVIILFASACAQAAEGPNHATPNDVAAGRWVDSLLGPEASPVPRTRAPKTNAQRRSAQRSSGVRGKLVRNPNSSDGSPKYALVDRYGGILRYVEPVDTVNLNAHLGQSVAVRRDTGDILLASQLALPKSKPVTARKANGLRLVQNLEPVPAGEPIPAGETVEDADPTEGGREHSVRNHTENDQIISGDQEMIYEGPVFMDEGYEGGYGGGYSDGLNFGGCPDCGDVTCGGGVCQGGGCGFGARGVFYAHAEYLYWKLRGMNTPPLVTQVPFDVTNPMAPVPIGPGLAVTLYGGNDVLNKERSGGRLTLGLWLDDYGQWGLEGDYLDLGELDEQFSAGAFDGNSPPDGIYIFRPFFNTADFTRDDGVMVPRGNALEDVDTNLLDGTVLVDVRSQFRSAGIRVRHNLCCRPGCSTGCGVGCGSGVGCGGGVGCGSGVNQPFGPLSRLCNLLRYGTRHTDVMYGLRWATLDESLQVNEDLQQIDITGPAPVIGDKIDVQDRFATENEFFGGEIGYETNWKHNRWSLNLLSKVAIGTTRQSVGISGFTEIDGTRTAGGLLTQRFELDGADPVDPSDDVVVGNIGNYERNEFSMIPEIGLTLGYNLTPRLKLTSGYTLLYWSNVVRPGDQIDLDVNGNMLRRDPVLPPTTTLIVQDDHPRFEFHQTDLWAHGLNFGAEYTW